MTAGLCACVANGNLWRKNERLAPRLSRLNGVINDEYVNTDLPYPFCGFNW